MNREAFYAEILPIVDAFIASGLTATDDDFAGPSSGKDADEEWMSIGDQARAAVHQNRAAGWQTEGLGIVGPRPDEIDRWMPRLAEAASTRSGWWQSLDDRQRADDYETTQPICLPLDNRSKFNEVIETFWAWRWHNGWKNVACWLIAPPGLEVHRQYTKVDPNAIAEELRQYRQAAGEDENHPNWKKNNSLVDILRQGRAAWAQLHKTLNPNTSPGLFLGSFLCRSSNLFREDTAVWVGLPDDELANGASRPLRRWAAETAFPGLVIIGEGDFLQMGGQHPLACDSAGEADDWEPTRCSLWLAPPPPFIPGAAWGWNADPGNAVEMDERGLFSIAGTRRIFFLGDVDRFVYRRRIGDAARPLIHSAEGWLYLRTIAEGGINRTEDDLFFTRDAVFSSRDQDWSVQGDTYVGVQPEWMIGHDLGFPVKTVAQVCDSIELQDVLTKEGIEKGDIVVGLTGRSAGIYTLTGPPTRTSQVEQAMILKCPDQRFLLRQLADAWDYILATSFGTIGAPIIPQHLIRNLRIYWPPAAIRAAITNSIDQLEDSVLNKSAQAERELDRLKERISSFLDAVDFGRDEDHAFPNSRLLSPLFFEQEWQAIRHAVRRIEERLRNLAGSFWRDDLRRPPLLLGYQRRRLESTTEPQGRIKLSLEYAEILLRHYCYLAFVAWQGSAPPDFATYRKTWLGSGEARLASLGHWESGAHAAIKALAQDSPDAASRSIKEVCALLRQIDTKGVASQAQKVTEWRNNNQGHGFAAIGATASRRAEEVESMVEELAARVSPIQRVSLIVVDDYRNVADEGSWLRVRHLNGDNELLEPSRLPVEPDMGAQLFSQGVYLMLRGGADFVSMSPWLVFGTGDEDDGEALWMWDGTRGDATVYKSPMRPGKTLLRR